MGYEPDYEPSPTPKLSLYSLPNKLKELPGLSTPPIHTLASVPFQWEEAPGKPRPCTNHSKSKAARCLELPPRLFNEANKVNNVNIASPTTVLDGPYYGHQSLSRSKSMSFANGTLSFSRFESPGKKGQKGRSMFGSSRWGGFMKKKDGVDEGVFDFSSHGSSGDDVDDHTKVKILRIRRKSSFFTLSSSKSQFLTNMYESFKQVVQWKRRQPN